MLAGLFKATGDATKLASNVDGNNIAPSNASGSPAGHSAKLDSADAGNGSSSFSQSENVIEGEVGIYGDLAKRSVRDGLTPDHIPSFAAVKENLRKNGYDVDSLSNADLRALRNNTNCVVVKTCDHQTFSRTFGGITL